MAPTLCTLVVKERSFTVSELFMYRGSLSSQLVGTEESALVYTRRSNEPVPGRGGAGRKFPGAHADEI